MLSNIGFPGLVLILIVALIVFGPQKLPEIGRAVGQSLREFKNSASGITQELMDDKKEVEKIEVAKVEETKIEEATKVELKKEENM